MGERKGERRKEREGKGSEGREMGEKRGKGERNRKGKVKEREEKLDR
jgi:hypothetical protein